VPAYNEATSIGQVLDDKRVGARTGDRVHVPLFRRPAKWTLSRQANHLARTRIPDPNSGMRVFRKGGGLIGSQVWQLKPLAERS
jgi:hypothetical protein